VVYGDGSELNIYACYLWKVALNASLDVSVVNI
jgi:hypothetical protein